MPQTSKGRDPRVDPKVGDILRKGTILRAVIGPMDLLPHEMEAPAVPCNDGGWIKKPRQVNPTMKQFRKWAQKAEIINRAD